VLFRILVGFWRDAGCVAIPARPNSDPPAPSVPENISALVARVLNQLSISAWLPGAVLIAGTALLLWFRANGGITVDQLGSYVQANWIPVLVLALPSLVLSTLISQAFSFGAIQLLEGYWRRRGPASWMRTLGIKVQLHRKTSMTHRHRKALARTFRLTRPTLLNDGIDIGVLTAIEADYDDARRPLGLTTEQHATANDLSVHWIENAPPWHAAKLQRFKVDLSEFPDDSRILPTRLGNILRSTEDGLSNQDGNLTGFVMRNRQYVPPRILEHHDQFRTRLDMYCTLVLISIALLALSVPLLWQLSFLDHAAATLATLAMAWGSYEAAIASARGYVIALAEIDEAVGRHKDEINEQAQHRTNVRKRWKSRSDL
jgi:hypothetical protein